MCLRGPSLPKAIPNALWVMSYVYVLYVSHGSATAFNPEFPVPPKLNEGQGAERGRGSDPPR